MLSDRKDSDKTFSCETFKMVTLVYAERQLFRAFSTTSKLGLRVLLSRLLRFSLILAKIDQCVQKQNSCIQIEIG